jgi:uroporphyrinogen-III decarboxylase
MNSRERMIAAMECRPVDRVPVLPCLWFDHIARVAGIPYGELLAWPDRMYGAARTTCEFYGADGLRVMLAPPEGWRDGTVVGVVDGEEMLLSEKDRHPVARFDLAGGGKVEMLDESVSILDRDGWPVSLRVESLQDVRKMRVTAAADVARSGQTAGIRRLVQELEGRLFVVAFAAGGFTMNAILRLRGAMQGMMDLIDEPALVHAIIDRALEAAIEKGKALADAGVDGLYFGDSSASSSMISPEHYRDYCQPAYRAFVKAMRAYKPGLKLYQHCCGDYNPILEMAADEGADALHGLDPSKGMDLADIRRRLGNKVCLWGGVATGTLLNGTVQDVEREARQCMRDGGPEGYILDAACAIPPDSPFANVRALCDAPRRGPVV